LICAANAGARNDFLANQKHLAPLERQSLPTAFRPVRILFGAGLCLALWRERLPILQTPLSHLAVNALNYTPALESVLHERSKQDDKWGQQDHDPFTYLTILSEEVGEFSQAALHLRFGGPASFKLREEAVQVAAVALALIECLDRNNWTWAR
jgi:NTP pyrophosphatase (non-canonical NTP hydrolase)